MNDDGFRLVRRAKGLGRNSTGRSEKEAPGKTRLVKSARHAHDLQVGTQYGGALCRGLAQDLPLSSSGQNITHQISQT